MKFFKLLPFLMLLGTINSLVKAEIYYEEPVYNEPGYYYEDYYSPTFGQAVTSPVTGTGRALEELSPVTEPVGEVVEGAGEFAGDVVDAAVSPLRGLFGGW